MPHYQFPCNYVYWQDVENHEELKKKYMSMFDDIEKCHKNSVSYKKNPFINCNLEYSSIRLQENYNNFLNEQDIKHIIWNPIDNFIKEINSKYAFKINVEESIIHCYWFNTYNKGDYQEYHEHNDHLRYSSKYPIFSGIYIINDDNEKSSIVFKTPSFSPLPFVANSLHGHVFDTGEVDDIKEGTVIIFPSQLEHMVKACVKPGRRTIAFNVFSKL
jgi:hypothetical protein